MEQVEEIRHTKGIKEIYQQRKQTIERVFADVKEKHGMRYTQYRGIAKIKMELNLLFAMNLKKMAIWKWRVGSEIQLLIHYFYRKMVFIIRDSYSKMVSGYSLKPFCS